MPIPKKAPTTDIRELKYQATGRDQLDADAMAYLSQFTKVPAAVFAGVRKMRSRRLVIVSTRWQNKRLSSIWHQRFFQVGYAGRSQGTLTLVQTGPVDVPDQSL